MVAIERYSTRPRIEAPIERLVGELQGNVPSRSHLETFRPEEQWFFRTPEGIHGIDHEARTLVLVKNLAGLLVPRGVKLDGEALGWIATTHDIGRLDDEEDPWHGFRSAAYAHYKLRDKIPPASIATVTYVDMWHALDDREAPRMTPELGVFKDGDALDRTRTNDLDPRYLRFAESQLLVRPAEQLFALSRQKQRTERMGMFDSVMQSGVDLGMIADR